MLTDDMQPERSSPADVTPGDIAEWTRKLSSYRTPGTLRAIGELAITVLPFAAIWFAMAWSLLHGHVWLYALLVLPAVGFLVRLFLIQHDCGHQAFFANRHANNWTGRLIGVLTFTAYNHWRRAHAIHHATSGNLDKRGVGDIDTLTVNEYLARPRWTRLRYRIYRHPMVMFLIGPAFIFLLQNRVPAGFFLSGWRPWLSTIGTDVAIGVLAGLLISMTGWTTFLLVTGPIIIIGATIGAWLFYVQHQFEDTYWQKSRNWSNREASLMGSSHYDLPPPLKWFTANIGLHHVHHLSSRIPFYRLPDVLSDHPQLRSIGRLTLRESFKCVRLTLWDEESEKMVTFRDAANRTMPAPD